jgi:hypothetical protein
MKWSSSGFLGVLAANPLRFGLALAETCQTFGFVQQQCQEGMTGPKSDTKSIHNLGNITYWTHKHIEEMKWSSSGFLGKAGFGLHNQSHTQYLLVLGAGLFINLICNLT